MEIPKCANHIAGSCERSATYIDGERNGCFVIKCRTCQGLNIWPGDHYDNWGRYQGFLKQKMNEEQESKSKQRQRTYSFGG